MFLTKHGHKIHCGDIITNGHAVFEVECISGGMAHCQRIETCADDERFYNVVASVAFHAYEIADMWIV